MARGRASGRGPGRHRSGLRARSRARRFLLFRVPRPAGRRRRGQAPSARPGPQRELAALISGLASLATQLEELRVDVAVLGGRLDAVAARIERLAATPPPAPVVVPVLAPPVGRRPALRLPLVRAALAAPLTAEPGEPTLPVQQVREEPVSPVQAPDVA